VLPDAGSPRGLDRSSVFYNMTAAEVHPPAARHQGTFVTWLRVPGNRLLVASS